MQRESAPQEPSNVLSMRAHLQSLRERERWQFLCAITLIALCLLVLRCPPPHAIR